MASKGDYGEQITLQWLLNAGGVTPTRPTARKIALYTTDPDEAGAGGVEVSAGSWTNYVRQDVTFGAVSGTNPTQSQNTNLVDFGVATTTGNITVVGFAVVDASGNLLYGPVAFGTPQIVQNGNPVQFAIGSLTVTED